MATNTVLLSFVIPLHNEEDNVYELYHRVRNTAEGLGYQFEMVCINDCSSDSTLSKLKKLREHDSQVKIVSLSRRFGHQSALSAGIQYASGDCAAILDGDLQDPPEVVAEMVHKWRQGYKVVNGIRRNRKEGRFLRTCYSFFYYLLNKFSPVDIPRDVGDFCLLDRQALNEIKNLTEYKPFWRGLRAWVGFSQTGVEYDRPARKAGESKYSLWHLYQLALDGFMSFTDVFLLTASILGFLISGISFAYGCMIVVNRLLVFTGLRSAENLIPGWTTVVCLIAFFVGLQFIYLGLLGKYIGRIFMHTKNRPHFIVEELHGIDTPARDFHLDPFLLTYSSRR